MHENDIEVVYTPGEIGGIGLDLILIAAVKKELPCKVVLVCDANALQARAHKLNLAVDIIAYQENCEVKPGQLVNWHVAAPNPNVCNEVDINNAVYTLNCLKLACNACLKKKFHALVTGPIHKAVINQAGISFQGHTEYLANVCCVKKTVMMLMTEGLRVALLTTHIPLQQVASKINSKDLIAAIKIINFELKKRFNIANPTILTCGLNPHAGEQGYLGQEEIQVIAPVIKQLQQENIDIFGPYPADTIFTPKYLDKADVILTMYHDQGLPVLKYKAFNKACNITLGLPIIRTSVDHGTALDLAGTGNVDTGSLVYALATAMKLKPL